MHKIGVTWPIDVLQSCCSRQNNNTAFKASRAPDSHQWFFFSRNISQVTPKIIHLHNLIKSFLDQSILKALHLILKTEALAATFFDRCTTTLIGKFTFSLYNANTYWIKASKNCFFFSFDENVTGSCRQSAFCALCVKNWKSASMCSLSLLQIADSPGDFSLHRRTTKKCHRFCPAQQVFPLNQPLELRKQCIG